MERGKREMEALREDLQSFSNAVTRGQSFLHSDSSSELMWVFYYPSDGSVTFSTIGLQESSCGGHVCNIYCRASLLITLYNTRPNPKLKQCTIIQYKKDQDQRLKRINCVIYSDKSFNMLSLTDVFSLSHVTDNVWASMMKQ